MPGVRRQRVSAAERAFLRAAINPDAPIPAAPVPAPHGARSNRRRGTAVEGAHGGQGVAALLRREGYTVVRSHESRGAADVVGLRARGEGPAVRAVQAKRLGVFRPSGLNEAVARFLGLGRWVQPFTLADGTRESWLWVDGEGWVARATLDAAGTLRVEGPRREEVERSLTRMLAQGGPPQRQRRGPTLEQRLTQGEGEANDMAVVTASNKASMPELELDEVYDFVVTRVEPAEDDGKFQRSGDEPREVVTLAITDENGKKLVSDEGTPITLRKWVTIYNPARPRSALYGMASALLFGGEKIPDNAPVDTDDFVGKRGRLLWGMVQSMDGKTSNPGIKNILPPSRKPALSGRRISAAEIDSI